MILQKRPHFNMRDGALYFLNSARSMAALSPTAQTLFERLDDSLPVATLTPAENEALKELTTRGLCDLIAPVTQENRTRVLVLEPHCDDAALSIGALMWLRRNTQAFTLVTLASRSNYTSSFHTGRDFFDRDVVTDLRCRENEIFMQHLGGSYHAAGLREATLRYKDSDWTVPEFHAHRSSVAINNNRQADEAVLARWTETVEPLICDSSFSEIWIPLGAGTHSDHDLTRNAALRALMRNPDILDRADIYFYKDVPYGIDHPEHTERVLKVLQAEGAGIEDAAQDVTAGFDKKLELLDIFASQFKAANVHPGVRRSATTGSPDGQFTEHLWRMKKLPKHLDTAALFFAAPEANAISADVAQWRRGGQSVRHLRVLALGPSGNWRKDEAALRTLFPNARIEVFASPATCQEINDHKEADIDLKSVERGSKPWALLALKLALSSPSHILFIAGDRMETAQKLSKIWPLSPTLVVRTTDHLTLALATPV